MLTIFSCWPTLPADLALVMFDPPRLFHGRERALWTPQPEQLPQLCGWLQRCGVQTLAIVLPHTQGSLPQALQHGLANLDEQAVVALGIRRVLVVHSARKPAAAAQRHPLQRLARWMLGAAQYMLPRSEQPVRAHKVADLVDLALQVLPEGIHVVAPETVWQAAQMDTRNMRELLLRLVRARRQAPAPPGH